jgi:VanZ family protein
MRVTRATSLVIAALLYGGGISLVSLSPLGDWQFIPTTPWAFLAGPWPKYWTGFDVLVNVLAYIPFGLLICQAVADRLQSLTWRGLIAFVMALACGLLLSVILESLQTYLPTRRPSLLDVAANLAGTGIGAFFASAHAQNQVRLRISETRPVEIGSIMLLAIWVLAQAAPQQTWLALGDIALRPALQPMVIWPGLSQTPDAGLAADMFAAQRILAEALCVCSAILSCALICHLTLLGATPRWWADYQPRHWLHTLALVVAATVLVRSAWILMLLSPEALLGWFNAGTQAGILLCILSAYGLAAATPSQQRVVAISALCVTLTLANLLPDSDYAAQTLASWSKGRWFNLQSLANFAASAWPFAALGWLSLALSRRAVRAIERGISAPTRTIGPG